MRGWTVRDSMELYNVATWGAGFFTVNDKGHVEVRPRGEQRPGHRSARSGAGSRSSAACARRCWCASPTSSPAACTGSARRLRQARSASTATRARYRGVYPIKVNQQRHVVEEIVEYGAAHDVGLEAGSKPELLIALALLDTPGRADHLQRLQGPRATSRPALLAQRLGRTPIIVIDRFHEVDLIIKTSRELGIRPHIGVRARLTTKGAGKWIESTGDRSKFGLTAVEIVEAVERLRSRGHARLPRAAALPHRLADHRDPRAQGRAARGQPHLRRPAPDGRAAALRRRRRRPRRRLRRLADQLPLVDELHGAGVRQRRRRRDPGGLRRRAASRTRTSSPRPAAPWSRTTRC